MQESFMKQLVYIIDQARSQDGWILAEFSFCVFMDRDFVSVHKNAKRELGQYPAILTELAWSIKDLLYGIKSTEKMIFVLVYFRALKRKPVICKSDNAFRFSRFLVPSRQINHRKSFYCHGKYLRKKTFVHPLELWRKFICGNETGNPGRAVSLHLARSGSQSEHRICRILPARGTCHIINTFNENIRDFSLLFYLSLQRRKKQNPRCVSTSRVMLAVLEVGSNCCVGRLFESSLGTRLSRGSRPIKR